MEFIGDAAFLDFGFSDTDIVLHCGVDRRSGEDFRLEVIFGDEVFTVCIVLVS